MDKNSNGKNQTSDIPFKYKKILKKLKKKKKKRRWPEVAQRCCGVSIFGNIQNLTGYEEPAPIDPALGRELV